MRRRSRPARALRLAPLFLALSLAGSSCKDSTPPASMMIERERAAALYAEGEYSAAHDVLERVAEEAAASPQDLVNLAAVKLRRTHETPEAEAADVAAARELCERALEEDANLASAHYVLGIIAAWIDQDLERARQEFDRAVALAPDDVSARFRLGVAYDELEDTDAAIAQFEWILARDLEANPPYYVSAVYRLQRLVRLRNRDGDAERALELMAEYKALTESKTNKKEALNEEEGKYGLLGVVILPRPEPRIGTSPREAPAVSYEPVLPGLLAEAGAVSWVEAADLDGDGFGDLAVAGETGLWIARSRSDGSFATQQVSPRPFVRVAAHDLEHNAEEGGAAREFRMSLVAISAEGVELFSPGEGAAWEDTTAALPTIGRVRDVVAVDFDHEGHLDLAFATDAGLVLVRNDGVPLDQASPPLRTGPIRLVDASAGLQGKTGAFDWVLTEDFDADQDVDLLAGGASAPTVLFSSARRGRFEAQENAHTGLPEILASRPLLHDFDHDARVDVLAAGAAPGWQRNEGDGTFAALEPLPSLTGAWTAEATLADLDLDGELDLVAERNGGVTGRLGSLVSRNVADVTVGGHAAPGAAPVLYDLDLDGDADFVGVAERGVDVRRASVPAGSRALVLLLRGKKDNAEGIGALVELRTSEGYLRRYARRSELPIGLGGATPEVVRVLWPNGIVQGVPQVEPKPPEGFAARPLGGSASGGELVLLDLPQKEGAVGSCPFLYAWDGSEYVFISDVLGTTPLGLPMMDGMYVPPDHDELVRVTSDQLRPVEGELRFQFTEELRETTYLDRAELWVVEHDAGVEVHPEERFSFPPFPPQTVHAIRDALPIVRAVDQDGRDWTEELVAQDRVHAVPFEPLDTRYLGLATRHSLEITLPDGVRTAERVRLLMTGWLQWSDASVNVSAHRTGTLAFVPPTISVPDGNGGWRPTGPPVGFPAGKTKTMVLDVGPLLDREDPRILLSTTIRLYWDEIRVALDDGDDPLDVTRLEPKRAELWQRGFSAPLADERPDQPELFDWERTEPTARWNQHVGMLTRYGDVRPLLGAIDDEFVILSSGDAIDLRFDATGLAPLAPGRARTYLVYFDGWAKDADPNTEFSQTVEPLPFHGMSGYPYAATEHYPDDAEHERYRREWNTRPGARLIEDLAQPAAPPAPQ